MADYIARLKVDSKEYDAKLQRATQGMLHLEESLRKTGKTMADVDKDQLAYIRDMGKMETVSKTARGRVNELNSAYVELASQYKRLSQAEKDAASGRAMAQAMEDLKRRANEAKQSLNEVQNSIQSAGSKGGGADMGGFMSGLTGSVLKANVFTMAIQGGMKMLETMKDLVAESAQLAQASEGVRMAFDRLNRPDLLDGLRQATHGTVTDFELMKAAVKFSDFKLPVEELGTMLAFAQQKAKDTGQSVDYMVDSIVTGLGRKSLMILDNLGLSATEIRERMKETGDMTKAVGAIIRDQMSAAGDYVETAADRATQADVELKNAMEELGRTMQPLTAASNQFWQSFKVWGLDVLKNVMEPIVANLTTAGRLQGQLAKMNGFGTDSKVYQQQQAVMDAAPEQRMQKVREVAQDYSAQIGALQREVNARGKGRTQELNDQYKGISTQTLQDQIKALQQMFDEFMRGVQIEPPKQQTATTTTTTTLTDEQEKAAKLVEEAQRTYAETMQKSAIRMEAGLDSTLEGKRKELAAQERLFDAYNDAYATYQDPAYKEAANKAAESIGQLAKEVSEQTAAAEAEKQSSRALEAAQKKLADAQNALAEAQASGDLKQIYAAQSGVESAQKELSRIETIRVNVEQGEVDLPSVPTGDQTIRVNVEQGEVDLPSVPTEDQTIRVNVEQGEVDLPSVPTGDQTIRVNVEQGEVDLPSVPTEDQTIHVNFTKGNLDFFISDLKKQMADAEIGSELLTQLQEQLSDATAISTILQTAIQNGLDTSDFGEVNLLQKIMGGDISDDEIAGYVEQLNELLKSKFDETEWPEIMLKFDVDSKNIEQAAKEQQKDSKNLAKDWQDAGNAISAVGAAMETIKNPAAKVIGTIAQAIGSVAMGAGAAIAKAGESGNPWAWIAFAAAATATMITTISSIHNATGYANGGIVGGNSFSGDNVQGLVDGVTPVGLNAGEVILNKAQQNNVASALQDGDEGGGRGMSSQPYLTGETIFLGLTNYLRSSGRGELVLSRG